MALHAWVYLVVWISLSCGMILMNKAILTIWNFGQPFFLTAWHMLFATILTQVLARTTNLLPGVEQNKVSPKIYYQKIIPIAMFFAASLSAGNKAYIFLSVSYIQMLKAFTPVCVLTFSFFAGLEKPSLLQILIVLFISTGVTLTSVGELKFNLIGFILQVFI